jgi:FixJ family two-component response regulator
MATMRARIAVVEDDPGVRTALHELLRSAAFEARTFGSAEEFLAANAANGGAHVDCLITDINLPGMSGVALFQALRTSGVRLRVVLITGRDDPETLSLIHRAGGVPVLRKPFSDDELFDAIQGVLQEPLP